MSSTHKIEKKLGELPEGNPGIKVVHQSNDTVFYSYERPEIKKKFHTEDPNNLIQSLVYWKKIYDEYEEFQNIDTKLEKEDVDFIKKIKDKYPELENSFLKFYCIVNAYTSNFPSYIKETLGNYRKEIQSEQDNSNDNNNHNHNNDNNNSIFCPFIARLIYKEFIEMGKIVSIYSTCCSGFPNPPINDKLMRDVQSYKEFRNRTILNYHHT